MLATSLTTSTWSLHHDDVKLHRTRSVNKLFTTTTCPPYGKSATLLTGYAPTLAEKPVQIKVEYARPLLTSATVKKADACSPPCCW